MPTTPAAAASPTAAFTWSGANCPASSACSTRRKRSAPYASTATPSSANPAPTTSNGQRVTRVTPGTILPTPIATAIAVSAVLSHARYVRWLAQLLPADEHCHASRSSETPTIDST